MIIIGFNRDAGMKIFYTSTQLLFFMYFQQLKLQKLENGPITMQFDYGKPRAYQDFLF